MSENATIEGGLYGSSSSDLYLSGWKATLSYAVIASITLTGVA